MNQHLPWQNTTWSRLTADIANIPHGLLLAGQPGIGKLILAKRFSELLLCDSPVTVGNEAPEACGKCKSCMLNESGSHPDFLFITPEDSKKVIAVDQTRELGRQLQLKSHIAKRKVAIIHPAEAMNINSANSLLKILEEPPQDNVIVLVSNNLSQLPATVRSRCIKFNIPVPDAGIAGEWLRANVKKITGNEDKIYSLLGIAGGAPLLAKELMDNGFSETRRALIDDVVGMANQGINFSACAKKWKDTGSELCILWFQVFLSDLVKLTMLDQAVNSNMKQAIVNQELVSGLQLPKKTLNLSQLFEFIDVISESKKLLAAPIDEQLLLEDIFIRWQRLLRG